MNDPCPQTLERAARRTRAAARSPPPIHGYVGPPQRLVRACAAQTPGLVPRQDSGRAAHHVDPRVGGLARPPRLLGTENGGGAAATLSRPADGACPRSTALERWRGRAEEVAGAESPPTQRSRAALPITSILMCPATRDGQAAADPHEASLAPWRKSCRAALFHGTQCSPPIAPAGPSPRQAYTRPGSPATLLAYPLTASGGCKRLDRRCRHPSHTAPGPPAAAHRCLCVALARTPPWAAADFGRGAPPPPPAQSG